MKIQFFNESKIPLELEKEHLANWVKSVVHKHNKNILYINYILLDDDGLLKINQEHLHHNYYTDIITFDLSDTEEIIEAEIYISLDRVKENSSTLQIAFESEFRRVAIHGILHLLGYGDKTEEEKIKMREAEDACLAKWVSRETNN